MRPSEFCRLLWGEQPPGLIQLWQLQGKRSWYLNSPARADYYADGQTDVYVGVGLAHADHGKGTRTRNDQVIGLPGLWLDIDVNGGPTRKTGGVPAGANARILATTIAQPTVLVNSGYGLHAWYLFDQPWRFATRDEQAAAATASAQWYALHRAQAAKRGWGLDHTHDLARLLRLPGTYNGKGPVAAPVTLLHADGPRYPREQLLWLAAQAGDVTVAQLGAQLALAPDTDAGTASDVPVRDRLRALIANDETFADTWRNQRADDVTWKDQTMSGYDLSVAAQLVAADWTDTDIGEAIRLHRLRHDSGDTKGAYGRYLARTIARARERDERDGAIDQLRQIAAQDRAAA